MAKKKTRRARTTRRATERAVKKLIADQEKLAALEPGGSRERPLTVPSAAVVESSARGLGCLHCDAVPKVEAHEAERVGALVLRRVALRCARCGGARTVWVHIVRPQENLN